MRRVIPLLMFLFYFPGCVWCQNLDWTDQFYLGVGGVLEMPTNSQAPGYGLGSGLEVVGGYCVDETLSIQTQLGAFSYFSSDSTSLYMLRPLAELKLSLDLEDFFQPYCFFGPGLNFSFYTNPLMEERTYVNFALAGGVGLQFDFGDISPYVEAKYDFLFANGTPADSPIEQAIPLITGVLFPL